MSVTLADRVKLSRVIFGTVMRYMVQSGPARGRSALDIAPDQSGSMIRRGALEVPEIVEPERLSKH